MKIKGKVGYCFDWLVGNNWFVILVYLIVIIIKLLVLCKERCKYFYCYEVIDCNIMYIIKLKYIWLYIWGSFKILLRIKYYRLILDMYFIENCFMMNVLVKLEF